MKYINAQDVLPEELLKNYKNMQMENIFISLGKRLTIKPGVKKVVLKDTLK